MKEDEVRQKFALLAGKVLKPEAVPRLADAVDHLDQMADVKELVALL